ncbi:metalloregulator ArsR/SmtB family transcription factor [Pseudoalteromonas tunicata]|jgi:ArsR family transcriptional regulator|uniref:Transcriptional regulator, ArsR family protein n=1 Tax=Pseudoalteromonas tunicata D2 TaxID=87626 RepID=A4C844_9GAMM|nr:metalloregulator ArsR/SmtB family transcription factor [Pseudoalteromonas tunicata]ATC93265.1 ArsR family transcriptional regulator [Pseudoalteromonas tunicata]AXT32322.1 ArsR family transcriptional regulator [Pseudoalteromonas tunicata]EAR28759.1 transcriptional regulator, ArsR family protein [Pseudoalteromonas tunicata D2]
MNAKKTVLFLCTENSARSQIAEALLRTRAGDLFDVFSAGTHPTEVDSRTLDALTQFGIKNTHLLAAKNVQQFSNKKFDYVITLCNLASAECNHFQGADHQLAWDCTDPKTRIDLQPFYTTLLEINNRIAMFLHGEGYLPKTNPTTCSAPASIAVDPLQFYKALSDEIRLKTLMLTHYHGELCVCELMIALGQDCQPKVSRNLAILKKAHIISDRKQGQWVFYRIHPNLPLWAKAVLAETTQHNINQLLPDLTRLSQMANRPDKQNLCNV